MDLQKEREAFDKWHYEQYLLENPNIDISNAKYIYDYAHKNALVCQLKESHFLAWQAAKTQAVPEWIRMEDKYPKAGESVLICINGIRQNIAYFYDCSVSNEYSDHDWFEPVFTGGEAGDECVVKTEDVTHWMLLPKEPAND